MKWHNILRCLYPAFLPFCLVASIALSDLAIPSRSPLTVLAISWGLIALLTFMQYGLQNRPTFDRDTWYIATPYIGFVILRSIAGDGNSIRGFIVSFLSYCLQLLIPQGCLPLFVLGNLYRPKFLGLAVSNSEQTSLWSLIGPNLLLFIAILASAVQLVPSYCRAETAALAIGAVSLLASGLSRLSVLLAEHGSQENEALGISKEGLTLGHETTAYQRRLTNLYFNASVTIALTCTIFSALLESKLFSGASSMVTHSSIKNWRERLFVQELVSLAVHVGLEIVKSICLLKTVR
jgi:hypothetical protein